MTPPRIDRRIALKWMFAAAASTALVSRSLRAQAPAHAKGYGTDPNLIDPPKAGELWPLTFDNGQRRTTASLCDVMIPADEHSPSASALGVVDFIDEWISAPYPTHEKDRALIVTGLAGLESEAMKRFSRPFPELSPKQTEQLCDDLCHEPDAPVGLENLAVFFNRFRDLTAGGFYTTLEGRRDLRYIGNIPLATFDGPPPEVLRQAGVTWDIPPR